jgi:hypothetical protein
VPALDILDGAVNAVRSIVNPDELCRVPPLASPAAEKRKGDRWSSESA